MKTLGLGGAPRRPQLSPELPELMHKFGQKSSGWNGSRGGEGFTPAPPEAATKEAASVGGEVLGTEAVEETLGGLGRFSLRTTGGGDWHVPSPEPYCKPRKNELE